MQHVDTIVEDPYGPTRNAIANVIEDIDGAQLYVDAGETDKAKDYLAKSLDLLAARIAALPGSVAYVTDFKLGRIAVRVWISSPAGKYQSELMATRRDF